MLDTNLFNIKNIDRNIKNPPKIERRHIKYAPSEHAKEKVLDSLKGGPLTVSQIMKKTGYSRSFTFDTLRYLEDKVTRFKESNRKEVVISLS